MATITSGIEFFPTANRSCISMGVFRSITGSLSMAATNMMACISGVVMDTRIGAMTVASALAHSDADSLPARGV
jgi:hypothetical protein